MRESFFLTWSRPPKIDDVGGEMKIKKYVSKIDCFLQTGPMPPKRRIKRVSIDRNLHLPSRIARATVTTNAAAAAPVPSTSAQATAASLAGPSRATRISAAARIHGNKGYANSVALLLKRHSTLLEYEPAVSSRDIFKFTRGRRSGSLVQTHIRFRFDYADIQKVLLTQFGRLFALQGDSRDAFEVVITFNAILFCKDTGTYSLFYGTDHRENNRMGAAHELRYGDTYEVRNLQEVATNIPVLFDMDQLLVQHRNAFPHSNVSVFRMLNIVYLIYQYRR